MSPWSESTSRTGSSSRPSPVPLKLPSRVCGRTRQSKWPTRNDPATTSTTAPHSSGLWGMETKKIDNFCLSFFEHIERIGEKDYRPNNLDILLTRVPTTGVVKLMFTLKNIDFKWALINEFLWILNKLLKQFLNALHFMQCLRRRRPAFGASEVDPLLRRRERHHFRGGHQRVWPEDPGGQQDGSFPF